MVRGPISGLYGDGFESPFWNVSRRNMGMSSSWNSLANYNTPKCLLSFAVLHSPIDERTLAFHEGAISYSQDVFISKTMSFQNVFGSTTVIFQ